MLQNAYFLAKIGADTAENEQNFAEILTICQNLAKNRAVRHREPPRSEHVDPTIVRLIRTYRESFLISAMCREMLKNVSTHLEKIFQSSAKRVDFRKLSGMSGYSSTTS